MTNNPHPLPPGLLASLREEVPSLPSLPTEEVKTSGPSKADAYRKNRRKAGGGRLFGANNSRAERVEADTAHDRIETETRKCVADLVAAGLITTPTAVTTGPGKSGATTHKAAHLLRTKDGGYKVDGEGGHVIGGMLDSTGEVRRYVLLSVGPHVRGERRGPAASVGSEILRTLTKHPDLRKRSLVEILSAIGGRPGPGTAEKDPASDSFYLTAGELPARWTKKGKGGKLAASRLVPPSTGRAAVEDRTPTPRRRGSRPVDLDGDHLPADEAKEAVKHFAGVLDMLAVKRFGPMLATKGLAPDLKREARAENDRRRDVISDLVFRFGSAELNGRLDG